MRAKFQTNCFVTNPDADVILISRDTHNLSEGFKQKNLSLIDFGIGM